MSDAADIATTDINDNQLLFSALKSCANLELSDNPSDYCEDINPCDTTSCVMEKMISGNTFSVSGNISTSSFASDDSIGDNILEENGRISLAYENLRTIPRRIAEKFATHTKCLDLSYNDFQCLSFLSFFDGLDTLILDRNCYLDVNTLPFLPNLKILWINNCNISNLVEWVERIQTHCPSLEYFSVLGNPDVNNDFLYSMPSTQIAACGKTFFPETISYREYILSSLPHLRNLDGVARFNQLVSHKEIDFTYSSSCGNSRKPSSSSSSKIAKKDRSEQIFNRKKEKII